MCVCVCVCVCVWKGSQSYLYSNEPCCFCATARLRAGFEHDAGLEMSCLDRWKRGYVLAAMGLARG